MNIPAIPTNAPFTDAQRSWLNGFFAGLFGQVNGNANGLAVSMPAEVAGASAAAPAAPVADENEEMPWHDPALTIDERMQMVVGKPLSRRLMGAMAQLDCGACGYVCKTYSEAIANGQEKDLTKCAPGGMETSKKLKVLVAEGGGAAVKAAAAPASGAAKPATLNPAAGKYGRHNPFPARLLECNALNKPGSMKDTRFVSLDLKGSGLSYKVGDALGVFPENDPDLVGWVLEALDASGAEEVIDPDGNRVSIYEALLKSYSLGKPTDLMFELLINTAADAEQASQLKQMLADDSLPEGDDVLDLLRQFPSAKPEPYEFVTALNPLQPRLYSISSSLKAHPDQVHLTVGIVRFVNKRERQCKGVCSTFFADRVKPGLKVRCFVHESHGFGVPANPDVPIIMVGPGTGIAPFRAFLAERRATGAKGKNWLLFGDQQKQYDYLYEQELEQLREEGFLTRLDLAFSRDQKEKIYVQNRMLEHAAEMWKWLQEGAHFYVCGDAKRMATDVDNALKRIAMEQGNMSAEQAKAFVMDLSKNKRYQRDVY
ncbi:sulfite reductase subunit alpha [Humisphaera borealis]|uniref:assimilatory sulfite reductase (NADPH) n=1 Tax=Humisphaera borealis TaxID=2807512 RepID=A0A7M2WYF9_9BACT|nr:sulfite reductase subunit alpha [Humisphaera borealis]QOV89560.1 sulfite reductase subunit alpha [Humisphaera borealis]